MNGVLWNIASFVIAIALLVTFHEWGHFLVARFFKIDVLRFSIGFGKPLFRWHGRKGTEYVVAAVPLGGYVKMLDEREAPVPVERLAYAFNNQSVAKRLAVVTAGPLFNFIFAFLAYWLMFVNGIQQAIPLVDQVTPNSIAAKANVAVGDEIIGINGDTVTSWRQVIEKLIVHGQTDSELNLTVLDQQQKSQTRQLVLTDWSLDTDQSNPIHALGITPYRPKIKPVVDFVADNEPAAMAGIQPGDEVISINNQRMHDWQSFVEIVRKSPQETLRVNILRNGKPQSLKLTPRPKQDGDELIGFVGIKPKVSAWPEDKLRNTQLSVIDSLLPASVKTWEMTKLTGVLLYKLVTGFVSPSTISGPIGIAQGAGASASGGLSHYLNFLALVSISLAILNLLPIPILDGGHIFYYLIESIRGKPISEKTQEIGFKLGLLFIVSLMVFAFYNDITRLLK